MSPRKPKQDQAPLDLLGWPNLSSNLEACRQMVEGEGWRLLCLDLRDNLEESHRRLYLSDEGAKAEKRRGVILALLQLLGLAEAIKQTKK
jgi:hypothetical protein